MKKTILRLVVFVLLVCGVAILGQENGYYGYHNYEPTFETELERSGYGKLRVNLRTNFEGECIADVMLVSEANEYEKHEKVDIADGSSRTDWFSHKGKGLLEGEYNFQLILPISKREKVGFGKLADSLNDETKSAEVYEEEGEFFFKYNELVILEPVGEIEFVISSIKQSSAEATPLAVYGYVQSRYKYYDEKYNNGSYSGDKYESKVFSDASSYFGISRSEVYDLYWEGCK